MTMEKIKKDFNNIKRPSDEWKIGDRARATSTGEEGIVVCIHWDSVTIEFESLDLTMKKRFVRFPIKFVEKINDTE